MDNDSRERVFALISEANSLLSTIDEWQLTLSGARPKDLNPTEKTQKAETSSSSRLRTAKHIDGLSKFRRRIQAELEFLKVRLAPFMIRHRGFTKPFTDPYCLLPTQGLESGEVKFRREHLSCSNLSHYAAIIARIAQEGLENVDAISKIFRFPAPSQGNKVGEVRTPASSQPLKIEIDIVCRNRACWVKVKAMSAEGVSAVVNGTAPGGHKSVLEVADQVLSAARYNLVHYQPPAVLFHFSRGLSKKVSLALRKRGVFVEGDIVETPMADFEESSDEEEEDALDSQDKELQAAQSVTEEEEDVQVGSLVEATSRDISIVNLDVTTLITMVSDITNGYENEDFADDILQQQAMDERQRLTLPDLEAFFSGKDVVATEMAIEKFQNIVRIIGGPREQKRATELSARIRVVPNAPAPEIQSLRAPKVKDQHRVIFGTGLALRATTATANTAFTGYAKSAAIFLSLHMHPARALTELKAAQYRASLATTETH